MTLVTLFDVRNFRFADTCRQKCNSSGESVTTSDSDELSEHEDRDNEGPDEEEEDHWFHDQDGSDCGVGEHEEFADVSLKSLRWVATLGVGGFGRVELVTVGQNSNKAFALKKMKKSEVINLLSVLKLLVLYTNRANSRFKTQNNNSTS